MKLVIITLRLVLPVIFLSIGMLTLLDSFIGDYLSYLYFPISFGLVIGIANIKSINLKELRKAFFALLLSLITFILILLVIIGIGGGSLSLDDSVNVIYSFIIYVIAPFFVLTAFFKYYDIKFTRTNIIFIIVAIVVSYSYMQFCSVLFENEPPRIANPYLIWQVVVAATLQSVLYKEELFSFFDELRSEN
ncbi:hypothetical protein LX97_01504 [Nonlabens dokdonensis]|jgi:hypothetical protein|uniref:Uncharacterized protein n=2 Tax=Nonlabens dokdonensis TaxID=328515 RepID=L7W5D3_NONDD|nr:hypothetical protein [Nonlabens dokdonensis]AGC76845.1 hypothetical protein DDD_1718 [Nonlabens dokdonensis DSW-6]PZX44486.1 hypothetical protein LX97_01504 [Nonlabens dokdonensis]